MTSTLKLVFYIGSLFGIFFVLSFYHAQAQGLIFVPNDVLYNDQSPNQPGTYGCMYWQDYLPEVSEEGTQERDYSQTIFVNDVEVSGGTGSYNYTDTECFDGGNSSAFITRLIDDDDGCLRACVEGDVLLIVVTVDDQDYAMQFQNIGDDTFLPFNPQGPIFSQQTRITNTWPQNSSPMYVNPTTTVEFQAEYYVNSNDPNGVEPLPSICVEIVNYSTMSSERVPTVPDCQLVTVLGEISATNGEDLFTEGFTVGDVYGARFYFIYGNGRVDNFSPWVKFSIVTTPEGSWQYWGQFGTSSSTTLPEMTAECDPEGGFWETSICNVAAFLFVPSSYALQDFNTFQTELPNRFPFAYFYLITNTIQTREYSNEVDQFGSLTLDFSDTVLAMEIDVLSTTTISSFAGNEFIGWIRDAMIFVVWLAFAIMVYFEVRKLFNTNGSI